MKINWEFRRLLRPGKAAAAVVLVLIAASLSLSACSTPAEEEGGEEAAAVEPIKGTDVNRITLTKESAERLGIETTSIRRVGGRQVVPDAAVVYASDGKTFTYSSPKPLTFVRHDITVDRINGTTAILKNGPAVGTAVVTVGSQELSGVENEYEPE
jgi:hypothetical protein